MNKPGHGRGQGLRLVVKSEGGKIVPGRIVAHQLGQRRFKHQTEQQPVQQPDAGLGGTQEDAEETGFEQQKIPLVSHENLSARYQRQVIDKQQGEQCRVPAAPVSGHQRQKCHSHASPGDVKNDVVTVSPPEKSGDAPGGGRAQLGLCHPEVHAQRQYPSFPNQTACLHAK